MLHDVTIFVILTYKNVTILVDMSLTSISNFSWNLTLNSCYNC